MRVLQKNSVILTVEHWKCSIRRILFAAEQSYPEDYVLKITRGCEEVEGGAKHSKHLPPIFDALDLRTRDLPESINREEIITNMQAILGSNYYGYYRKHETKKGPVEWIHFQYNRGDR